MSAGPGEGTGALKTSGEKSASTVTRCLEVEVLSQIRRLNIGRVTGAVVVDLTDLDPRGYFDDSHYVRERLDVVRHVPPGADVIIRPGVVWPPLDPFSGADVRHANFRVEAASVDMVRAWVEALRRALAGLPGAVVA